MWPACLLVQGLNVDELPVFLVISDWRAWLQNKVEMLSVVGEGVSGG